MRKGKRGRGMVRGKGVGGECRMFLTTCGVTNEYEFLAMSQKSRPSNEHRI